MASGTFSIARGSAFGRDRRAEAAERGEGARAAARRRRRGAKLVLGKGEKKEKKDAKKLKFSPAGQAYLDQLDQGTEQPYVPEVSKETLSGYGAPVATDVALGKVETVIRAMRLMAGGMAFNNESGVTADLTDVLNRYKKKQPVFLHSKGEKEWIERALPKHHFLPPDPELKKAIIDATVRGKYDEEATKFAELSDVRGIMANFHSRTHTYRASDSERFINKVLSLLPGGAESRPEAKKAQ